MGVFSFPGYNLLTCSWLPMNNILFQVANGWLFILYVGDFITFPSSFAYMVFLRIVLSGAAISFTLWAAWVLCSPDTALWNLIFFIYNIIRMVHLFYKEYSQPSDLKPRFEKLYNTCYKNSGISTSTYNKLIEGGTVISTPRTTSLILHKSLYSPNKVLQIISGRVMIRLSNGNKVRLREGDFINHNSWNFNSSQVANTTFVADYSSISDGLVVCWSYARLSELLKGQERRLFSYLLLGSQNKLLLHLSNLLEQSSTTLDITSHSSHSSSETSHNNNADTQELLLHQNNDTQELLPNGNCVSDSSTDSGIGNNGNTDSNAAKTDDKTVSVYNEENVSDLPFSNLPVSNLPVSDMRNSWSDEVVQCESIALLESETTI